MTTLGCRLKSIFTNTMMSDLPDEIKELSADSRGRVNLGTDYAGESVRVAVIEVVDDNE